MAEEKKDNKKDSQIENFMTFQKLMGDVLKQKVSGDPFLKGAEGALKKSGQKFAEEAVEQLGPEETTKKFLQMINSQPIQSPLQNPGIGQQQQQAQQPQQQQAQISLQQGGAFSPGGVKIDEQGNIQITQQGGMSSFGGVANRGQQTLKALIDAKNFLGQDTEALQKFKFDMLKQNFTQDRLDQRERLKNELKEAGEVDDNAIKIKTFSLDLGNFIQSFDNLLPKGGNKLRSGGLAIARAGGQNREEFANFEANSEILSFSLGDALLGQTGRAFTEPERLEVKKRIIAASTSATRGQFFGKMDAIINSVNNRIKTSGGTKLLPDARTVLKQKKGITQTQPGVQGAQKTSQGTSFKVLEN